MHALSVCTAVSNEESLAGKFVVIYVQEIDGNSVSMDLLPRGCTAKWGLNLWLCKGYHCYCRANDHRWILVISVCSIVTTFNKGEKALNPSLYHPRDRDEKLHWQNLHSLNFNHDNLIAPLSLPFQPVIVYFLLYTAEKWKSITLPKLGHVTTWHCIWGGGGGYLQQKHWLTLAALEWWGFSNRFHRCRWVLAQLLVPKSSSASPSSEAWGSSHLGSGDMRWGSGTRNQYRVSQKKCSLVFRGLKLIKFWSSCGDNFRDSFQIFMLKWKLISWGFELPLLVPIIATYKLELQVMSL